MVDVVVASAFVAAGVIAVNRRLSSSNPPIRSNPATDVHSDLPCPWCQAPTGEDDDRCPSCRQRFG